MSSDHSFAAERAPEDIGQVAVGSTWRSAARTLTESELGLACMLSTDWHPIHADAAYAAASSVGQRVFQGGYGVLLALGIATRFPAVGGRNALALGMESWRLRPSVRRALALRRTMEANSRWVTVRPW